MTFGPTRGGETATLFVWLWLEPRLGGWRDDVRHPHVGTLAPIVGSFTARPRGASAVSRLGCEMGGWIDVRAISWAMPYVRRFYLFAPELELSTCDGGGADSWHFVYGAVTR